MSQQDLRLALQTFKSWFAAHGGFIHPDLDFVYTPEAGVTLHVKATYRGTFPDNTIAISCPHALSLSALNAGKVGGGTWPPRDATPGSCDAVLELPEILRQQARPQFVAAVWVAVQYLLGEKSAWWPYLEVLPGVPADDAENLPERGLGELDTPMWWSSDERAWLHGTNLAKGIADLEAVWMKEWDVWGSVVEEWVKSVGLDLSWKLVKYGLTILGSRAFSSVQVASLVNQAAGQSLLSLYNPDMLLYPGVDSLNHNPMTRNRWHSDDKVFGIVVVDRLTAGMEIWNPYGGKSNGELLLSYGFCLENNPCESFAMKLGLGTPPILQLIQQAQGPSQLPGMPLLSSQVPSTHTTSPLTPHNRPLCQDLAQSIFYIRPASRHHLHEEGYMAPFPSNYTNTNSATPASLECALAGFPGHLINLFAAIELTNYEQDIISSSPSVFSPSELYLQTGTRKYLATINLFLARLNKVAATYEDILKRFIDDGHDIDTEDAHGTSLATTKLDLTQHKPSLSAARGSRRRTLVSIYLAGQLEAITSNVRTLSLGLAYALTYSLHSLQPPSAIAQGGLTPPDRTTLLLTSATALALLNEMTPGHNLGDALCEAIDFLYGIGNGNEGGAWHWTFVQHMRTREIEEVFWPLWVGLVAKIASATKGTDDGGWFRFLRDAYGLVVPEVRPDDENGDVHTSGEKGENDTSSNESIADADHDVEEYRLMDDTLLQLRTRTNNDGTAHRHNGLWTCPPWTGAFRRACVDAVMCEMLVIEYDTQSRLGKEMAKYERSVMEQMKKRVEAEVNDGGDGVEDGRKRCTKEREDLKLEQVMLDGEDENHGGTDVKMIALYVGKEIVVPGTN